MRQPHGALSDATSAYSLAKWQLPHVQVRKAEDHRSEVSGGTEGDISERRSKKGKTFYGCTRYPDCKFVAWGKPIAEKCPDCGSPYMIEKWLKAGPVWQCPNVECKHKQPAP